jgi:phasin family protein
MIMADKPSTNPFGLPEIDIAEMLRQFQLPGVDFEQLVDAGRKNIEAVQQANQAIAEGWQAIAEKQVEVFRESMEQLQKAVAEGSSGSVQGDAERQAALARAGFEKALENMRQMADIAAESQTKALDAIRARIEENVQQFTGSGTGSDDTKS